MFDNPQQWDGFYVGDRVEVLGSRGHIDHFVPRYKTVVVNLESGGTLSAKVYELTRIAD